MILGLPPSTVTRPRQVLGQIADATPQALPSRSDAYAQAARLTEPAAGPHHALLTRPATQTGFLYAADPLGEALRAQCAPDTSVQARDLFAGLATAPDLLLAPHTPVLAKDHLPRADVKCDQFVNDYFELFKAEYGDELAQRVRQQSWVSDLVLKIIGDVNFHDLKIKENYKTVWDALIEREMIFCRQMISRVAQARFGTHRPVTVLFDLDNTLFTYDRRQGWRPSTFPLLHFLTVHFAPITLGIASGRDESSLEGTLPGYIDPEALHGIAYFGTSKFVDSKVVPGYRNDRRFDPVVFGAKEPRLANIMGWSPADVDYFMQAVLPELIATWLAVGIDREHKKQFDSLAGIGADTAVCQSATDESLERARQDVSDGLVKLYSKSTHIDHDRSARFDIDVVHFLSELEKIFFGQDPQNVEFHPDDYLSDALQFMLVKFGSRYRELSLVQNEFATPLTRHVAQLLSVTAARHTMFNIMLQRLGAARREFDKGQAHTVIVIDNEPEADLVDNLLGGRISLADGERYLDGYALLGLESYRDRIFVTGCGPGGTYNVDEIEKEIKRLVQK